MVGPAVRRKPSPRPIAQALPNAGVEGKSGFSAYCGGSGKMVTNVTNLDAKLEDKGDAHGAQLDHCLAD